MIIQRVAKSLSYPLIYEKKKKIDSEYFNSEDGEFNEDMDEEEFP